MPKTLFILRHAKSSWDDDSLSDFDRPLNERGKQTAPFIGKLMREKDLEPSIIVSSPAARAKQTALAVKQAADFRCDVRFDDRIYEASPEALLKVVSEVENDYRSAMLVGHNPGMEGLVHLLTAKHEKMPTAALVIIELKIDKWNRIEGGCGKLIDVIRPKEVLQ